MNATRVGSRIFNDLGVDTQCRLDAFGRWGKGIDAGLAMQGGAQSLGICRSGEQADSDGRKATYDKSIHNFRPLAALTLPAFGVAEANVHVYIHRQDSIEHIFNFAYERHFWFIYSLTMRRNVMYTWP